MELSPVQPDDPVPRGGGRLPRHPGRHGPGSEVQPRVRGAVPEVAGCAKQPQDADPSRRQEDSHEGGNRALLRPRPMLCPVQADFHTEDWEANRGWKLTETFAQLPTV